ncbi:MAG: hypothetical protein EAX81_02255 [Candidatus Thorarchaeota archaeon]|nr:hypothetical protein [Candidatus Thorarchaeota archaeon]
MVKRKRTSVEDALEIILKQLPKDTPSTISEIASETNLSWNVVDRATSLAMDMQDYFHANKIEVLGGRGRKIVLVELRIDLTRLPSKVREWFIDEKFFKGKEKNHCTTDEARQILGTNTENEGRTKFESAVQCVIDALELEDELSILELSKRIEINRRTIERVLDFFLRFQEYFADFYLKKIEGSLVLRNHPDIYALDETRMIYMLKKLYLPHLKVELPDEKERTLFQTA